MPSFLDDAYDILTLEQLNELPRRVVRERGQVYYQHSYIAFRSLIFGPSRVWVLDRWDLGEIWLIGLQPDSEGDDPKPPAAKAMAAIRRLLSKLTPVVVYELLKMLRHWLQLNDHRAIQLALLVAAGVAQSEEHFEHATSVINPPDDIFVLGVLSTNGADLDALAIEQDLSVVDDGASITAKDCSQLKSVRYGSSMDCLNAR